MRAATPILYRFVVVLVLAVLVVPALAWSGESLVRMPLKGPFVYDQLRSRNIEVLAIDKYGYIDALVDDKQLDYILSLGYPVTVVSAAEMERAAPALDANLGLYHTFAEMESLITTWEGSFPGICDLFVIGQSLENRPIYALKISDNVVVDETDEAEVLYMGNIHAREIMTVEMTLLFAEYLLVNYGTDPIVTAHVDSKEIYFVCMVNPDGHVWVENNHSAHWSTWWRKNRRINIDMSIGVDLNRNFGFAWGYDDVGSSPTPASDLYRGTGPFSEPESQVIRDFVESREFTMWLSYHSYGELLLYPWGYIAEDTPDHAVFFKLGELLTEANGYLPGNYKSGAIYVVNGDTDDWGYGEQTTKDLIFAFTPEINTSAEGFGPDDTMIAPTFAKNFEMNMRVLEYCANPYSVIGPYRPTMFAIEDPFYPVHTLNWSSNVPEDRNPVQFYEVERCLDPSFITDSAEYLSSDWVLDGFSLGTEAYSGNSGYYSGSGDLLNHSITAGRPYFVTAESDTFRFWAKYDIETDWDYAYVDVSEDYGETWTTVQGNITTTYDPHGNNRGHGITGQTLSWVDAIFPLTQYLGQEIYLRISYITDQAVVEHGIDVDVLSPVPTCQSVDIIATSVTDTTLQIYPAVIGTYRYRVEGVDAESDVSGWSNSQTIVIDSTATAASTPLAYASRLEPNYPNPFNPATHIPYVVGGNAGNGPTQRVTLRIYDVAGRLVATLVDEDKVPGRYEAVWKGTDGRGIAAVSGVYFSRLMIGGQETFTRKLVLLK
jgi:hypothetical protein